MYSGLLVAVLLIIAAVFFLIYKRHMITRLFSLDIAGQVNDFKYDMQNTANKAVDKVTLASDELAELLRQSEETIEELKIRVKIAEEQLYKSAAKELQANTVFTPQETQPALTFAETLLRATRNTSLHLDLPITEHPVLKEYLGRSPAFSHYEETKSARREEKLSAPSIDMSGAEPKFKYKQIMRLADSGYSDVDIARTLGLGVGEVSLTRKFGIK